jgi:hypothetical protein
MQCAVRGDSRHLRTVAACGAVGAAEIHGSTALIDLLTGTFPVQNQPLWRISRCNKQKHF